MSVSAASPGHLDCWRSRWSDVPADNLSPDRALAKSRSDACSDACLVYRAGPATSIGLKAFVELHASTREGLAASVDREYMALPMHELDVMLRSPEHLGDEEASAALLAAPVKSGVLQ